MQRAHSLVVRRSETEKAPPGHLIIGWNPSDVRFQGVVLTPSKRFTIPYFSLFTYVPIYLRVF